MRLSKLKRKLLKQAKREYAKDAITSGEYRDCIAIAESIEGLKMLNERIEKDVNPWNRADGLSGVDWSTWLANLWDWFVANWPEILQIIVTIAPLLMEPRNES